MKPAEGAQNILSCGSSFTLHCVVDIWKPDRCPLKPYSGEVPYDLNTILKIIHFCASVHCFPSDSCVYMLTGGDFSPLLGHEAQSDVQVPTHLAFKHSL